MLQWPEILGILIVVLILFGAKKLPELARGLGQGIKEFKRATRDVQDDLTRAIDDTEYDSAPPKNHSSSPVEAPAQPSSDAASSEPADTAQPAETEERREAFLEGQDSSSKG